MSRRRLHDSRRPGLLGDLDRMQAGRLPNTEDAPPERDERGRLILLDPGYGRPFAGDQPDHRLACLECGEVGDCGCGVAR